MKKELLVTVKEAVELASSLDITDEMQAEEIYKAYMTACENNPLLLKEFVCAVLFNAGRIQGIREERKKSSHNQAT